MQFSKIPASIKVGIYCACIYDVFFFATLFDWISKNNSDGQIAAFIFAAPFSAWLHAILGPIIAQFSALGSFENQAAKWLLVFVAGNAQYFLVGFFIRGYFSSTE